MEGALGVAAEEQPVAFCRVPVRPVAQDEELGERGFHPVVDLLSNRVFPHHAWLRPAESPDRGPAAQGIVRQRLRDNHWNISRTGGRELRKVEQLLGERVCTGAVKTDLLRTQNAEEDLFI